MMKKIVALFLTCAMALSLTASAASSWYFNLEQWAPGAEAADEVDGEPALTFPVIYKGSLKWVGWEINGEDDESDICVNPMKISPELYMTICQPCFDCFPCQTIPYKGSLQMIDSTSADARNITAWNLYFVTTIKDGKDKYTQIEKVNLGEYNEAKNAAIFFTGSTEGKSRLAMVQAYVDAADAANGESIQFVMTGKKEIYSFNYLYARLLDTGKVDKDGNPIYGWYKQLNEQKKEVKGKFGIWVVKKFDGVLNVGLPYNTVGQPDYGYHFNGAVALKMDNTLTKNAANELFTPAKKSQYVGIGDCDPKASYCEKYFDDTTEDKFDSYLKNKYKKDLTQAGIVDADLDTVFADILLFVVD